MRLMYVMHLKGVRVGIADDATTTGYRAAGTTMLFEIQLVAGVEARIDIRLEKINDTRQLKTDWVRLLERFGAYLSDIDLILLDTNLTFYSLAHKQVGQLNIMTTTKNNNHLKYNTVCGVRYSARSTNFAANTIN